MTPYSSSQKKILFNIQYLRAFAALNVVFYHIIGGAKEKGYDLYLFDFMKGWGASGVDLFFVISGFIMVYIQFHTPRTTWQFLKNRVQRIVPIYWILTFFLIFLFFIQPNLFTNLQLNLLGTIFSFFFLSILVTGNLPALYLGWTLEYEMLFYLIFALSLFAFSLKKSVNYAFVVLAVLVVGDFSDPIILEFGSGMLIGLYVTGNNQLPFPKIILVTGLVLLCLSMFWEVNSDYRTLIWGVPSTLIVLSALYLPSYKNRLLLLLGDASYSIYLIQFFTIPFFYKFLAVFYPTLDGDLMALFSLIFTASVGCIVYSLVEKPIGNKLSK